MKRTDVAHKAARKKTVSGGARRSPYFRLRDFEYVQPLYDLAFLLEVDAIARGAEVPKYRTFSLWRAAYSLDGYSSTVDQWLDGELHDEDLDYVPSGRIKQYLASVRESGTIPELKPFRSPRFLRCLNLRSVRGLGPNKIALTVSPEVDGDEWFDQLAINVALDRDRLEEVYRRGDSGPWQSAHVVPPMFRLLKDLEIALDVPLRWTVNGIRSAIEPVTELVTVLARVERAAVESSLKKVLRKEKQFTLLAGSTTGPLLLRHQMRWVLSLDVTAEQGGDELSALIERLDPFSAPGERTIQSDLHLHTAWSDGGASVSKMAQAVVESGLTHFAVTDHSRSSKLQGGLTPPLWLRQAGALQLAMPVCPVFHGIEVDILKDGSLDLPHSLLRAADLVVASVHSNWSDDVSANTTRLVRAIQSGCIDILGHPTAALTGKPGVPDYMRPPADVDWEVVLRKCSTWKVALEFNCFPSRLDLPLDLLRKASDLGCVISLGSDAHARSHLANIRFGEAVLRQVSPKIVLNRLSAEQLRQWVIDARAFRKSLSEEALVAIQTKLFNDDESSGQPWIKATTASAHRLPTGSRVIGIDLTAGDKATGLALLDDLNVDTCSLRSDEEIVDYVIRHRPQIVSIDSPLGLPGGGETINPRAGIVRVAEHDLASIGIPAYPALIDSMRDLTLRGIRLRKAIEALPERPVVIESYPGAAQDILSIPRKQKGLELLREGLRRLGLTGNGLETQSHDEMDAITSALVGRYFEHGRFEPMGIPAEAQLIVPKVPPLQFDCPPIICLAGKTGAGKSVVARYLSVFYGFTWIRTRDVIKALLQEDLRLPVSQRLSRDAFGSQQITEKELRTFGAIILNDHGQIPLQTRLVDLVKSVQTPVVVDAIRELVDLPSGVFEERPGRVWFIECKDSLIRSRLSSKTKLGAPRLPEASPVDYTASGLKTRAHRVIANNGSLEELRWSVDDNLFADLDLHAR